MRSGIVRVAAVAALATGMLVVSAPQALAAESIRSFDARILIGPDGTLDVTETIVYDFGSSQRHGIFRDLRTRLAYDTTWDRIYPLEVMSVDVTDGPSTYEIQTEGAVTRIKIGDPDVTITGVHTYTIRYRLEGALNGFSEHDELYWNVTGLEWPVGMDRVSITVTAPGEITAVDCFVGAQYSTRRCRRERADSDVATFGHSDLFPYEGVTVVVGFPKGLVTPAPQLILEERPTLASAFKVTPNTVASAAGVSLALFSWLGYLVWARGRDRRFRGSQVAQVMGGDDGDEAVPLFDADTSAPVEFAPPEGIRPGLVGTLIDEKANTLDVTATIIDLAVRGHLMIREIPKEGWFGKPDWELIQLDTEDPVLPYEGKLLKGLFRDGKEVALSGLRTTFAARLGAVQNAMYSDLVGRKWFSASPKKVRERWALRGLGLTLLGGALTGGLATQRLGLVGLPVLMGGLFLLVASSRMPARTAKGTAMLRRVRGFRTVIEKAETHMSRWAEEEGVFTRYLPYAVVFGCTDKWAKAFESLGIEPDTSWYASSRPFMYMHFIDSMESFTVTTGGTISSTPGGSGSSGFGAGGFSGGGGGGGGGGSW